MVTRLSRRRLLQAGITGAAALALLRDAPQAPVDATPPARPPRGVTFIPGDVRYWGRDPLAVLDGLLTTEGLEVVRLPLYSWETSGRDGRWFFQRPKAYIERILDAGKSIIPVVGIKQPGYPEVHLPWRIRRDSTADQPGTILDDHPLVRQFALDVVGAYVEFLRDYVEGISAVQVENEANYPVGLAYQRRLSNAFLAEEIALVRQALPCRIMCTYPDAPEADWNAIRTWHEGLQALAGADIVGFNTYPQKLHSPAALADRQYTLAWVRHVAFPTARGLGLSPAIAEMQVTPWVEGKEGAPRPFSVDLNREDVRAVEEWGPSLMLLWGIDYAASPGQEHLWRHVTSLLSA